MWPFIKSKRKSDSKDFKYKYFSNDKLSENPNYELSNLYDRCVEEMTLQQSKRDQVFTLYLAMFSFLVPFALSTAGISDVAKGVIFIALAVIGWMFALIIERYRIYKESYWLCCQTITNLMSFKHGSLDKRTIQAVYYRCIAKKADKYIDAKKKKYKRLSFYKSNIFSGETIYYLIHSFITSGMVYLGIYQILQNNPYIPSSLMYFSGVIIALLVFAILTVFYFERLLEVYSVLLDDTGDAFNVAFSKAWFLHFYVEKSPFDLATSNDIQGEVLKGVIPNLKTFFHHLEEGKFIENDGQNGSSKILIVAKGAVKVNDCMIYEKGICAFSSCQEYVIKAEADTILIEINIRNLNDNNTNLPYCLNYADAKIIKDEEKSANIKKELVGSDILPGIKINSIKLDGYEKTKKHGHPHIQQLIYTLSDNKCTVKTGNEKVYLGGDTLFYIPLGSQHSVEVSKDNVAEYISIEYDI